MEQKQEIEDKEVQLLEFLKGQDFMKLGKAISSKNWNVAMMTLKRMEQTAAKLELEDMKRNILQIRQAVLAKNVLQGENGLALLVAKRVRLLKQYQES